MPSGEHREARASIRMPVDKMQSATQGSTEPAATKNGSKHFGARAARQMLRRGEEGCAQTTWRAGSGPTEAAQAARRDGEKGEARGFALNIAACRAYRQAQIVESFSYLQIVKRAPT